MKKIALISFPLICLLIFASSIYSQEVNITGDWNLIIQSQRGEMNWDVNFLQEGEDLSVTMSGPRGNQVTGKGKVKEKVVNWSVTWDTRRGEMTVTFSGTVENGKITGEAQFGSRGSREFTAEKKQ
ncbi:MAG: hypothetical protein ACOC57_00160 [Acidobacteriota bacterium]